MKLIYKHQDLIEIFNDISPFNMKRDIRFLDKNRIPKDKILLEIEATLVVKNYSAIYNRQSCGANANEIVLVKIRIKNPQNNKGGSSGFRVIAIVNECDDYAFIFNLYPKDGSKRKDNITDNEKHKAKELYNEVIE